jgi:hypothetical protein
MKINKNFKPLQISGKIFPREVSIEKLKYFLIELLEICF